MTPAERAENLRKIAAAAVALERAKGIPAELTAGQCILESGWLAKCPGNNCFGLKASKDATVYQTVETTEYLTDDQLERERRKGADIVAVSTTKVNGKWTVRMRDRFRVFADLEECFLAYGELLTEGKYFKARFDRFLGHRDLQQLLTDMSGADGQPPYFTGPAYLDSWRQITGQSNVKAALGEARAAAWLKTERNQNV